MKRSTCYQSSVLLWLFLHASAAFSQTEWTHVANEPVFDYGAAGQWDAGAVFMPAAIKDGDTLKMWYTGVDGSLLSPTSIFRIGYAWSLDGIAWTRYSQNPVLQPEGDSWQAFGVTEPVIIKENGAYKMWYGGFGNNAAGIGYATSDDGVHWTKHSGAVLDPGPVDAWDSGTFIFDPHAVIKEESSYKMWYVGSKGAFPFATIQIGLATSTDGISWVKYNDTTTTAIEFSQSDPVLQVGDTTQWDAQRVWTPSVLPTDSGYEMWYFGSKIFTGVDQFPGYATSENGIAWTKWPDNPVIDTSPAWGSFYLGGTVLNFNDQYHLWYASFTANGDRPRIGYAISEMTTGIDISDADPVVLEKYHLFQNYPNPFNPETTIRFSLPISRNVNIAIFSILGQPVREVINEQLTAGSYAVKWDGRDDLGRTVPSGIYLYRIEAGAFSQTRKMILAR